MAIKLTEADARESLNSHVLGKGEEIAAKYGPSIGWRELGLILKDPVHVRYPCEIVFDASQLQPAEAAFPAMKGSAPQEGYTIFVHPMFMTQLPEVAALVLYQLVVVNYGDFASPEDAETFGAAALGMDREAYYHKLCGLVDQL